MKLIYVLLTLVFMNTAQSQETTIYLIRHAEKADASANPDLSAEGRRRAQNYLAYFKEAGVPDAIYSTPYKRTQQTVQPIADFGRIPVTTYNPTEMSLKNIIEQHSGSKVLIVGHSNTIPKYINELLGDAKLQDLEESQYGKMYIVRMINGEISLEQLDL